MNNAAALCKFLHVCTKNVPLMHRINHLMIKVLGQSDQQKAWDYSSNIWGPC